MGSFADYCFCFQIGPFAEKYQESLNENVKRDCERALLVGR